MKNKPWVRKLHLWLAAVSSLPLIVVAVTGALLVFPEQTEDLFSTTNLRIEKSSEILPPSTILQKVAEHLPDGDRVVRLQYAGRRRRLERSPQKRRGSFASSRADSVRESWTGASMSQNGQARSKVQTSPTVSGAVGRDAIARR